MADRPHRKETRVGTHECLVRGWLDKEVKSGDSSEALNHGVCGEKQAEIMLLIRRTGILSQGKRQKQEDQGGEDND
jgi:hypothetical protein